LYGANGQNEARSLTHNTEILDEGFYTDRTKTLPNPLTQ